MTNSILCTNQARSNGVEVNDVPKIFGDGEHSQTIRFKEENATLDLGMHGPVPYLSIRCPTRSEIQDCQWLELTLAEQWNPDLIDQRVVLSVTTSLNQVLKPHPVDKTLLLYNLKDELYSRMKVFGVGRRYQKKYGPTEIARL